MRAKNQDTIEYQKNQEAEADRIEPFKQLSQEESKNTVDDTIEWPERKLSPKSRWNVG